MRESYFFGGGATFTTMTPIILVATLAAAVLVLSLPRKYVAYPILFVVFLTPFGDAIYIAGVHFFVMRILILAGCLRMLFVKLTSSEPLVAGGLQNFDKLFCALIFVQGAAGMLLFRTTGAVIGQCAFWLDGFGAYFLFRYLIRNKEEIIGIIKAFAIIVAVLGPCMLYEHFTGFNFFNYISYWALYPQVREHGFRAQAVFAQSITASSFGAALVPLFFWLWKSGKAPLMGILGMISATLVVFSSVASTGAMACLSGILALCLWPLRGRMRLIRWGIVALVAGLAMVMKAPVWFLIQRLDPIGGNGWDRAFLIDQFVRHFSDWWLLGGKDSYKWGYDTWDLCNEFVSEGMTGGILGFTLFIALLSRCFGMVGTSRKHAEGTADEWYFWCLGAALFANLMAFMGIGYYDTIRVFWYAFLAIVAGATLRVPVPVVSPAAAPLRWPVPRLAGATGKPAYSPLRALRTFRHNT